MRWAEGMRSGRECGRRGEYAGVKRSGRVMRFVHDFGRMGARMYGLEVLS